MVGDGRLLPRSGRARSLAGAGRESFRLAVKLARSEGSLLAGEQSGDRTQHRVEVLPAAEVPRQGPPVLQVADAVLDADPLSRVSPTFAPVRRGESGRDRQLVLPPGPSRGDHRTGGLRAQTLVAGVGEQGDARNENQQLDQAGLADLGQIMNGARAGLPANSSRPSASLMTRALTVLARALPETNRWRPARPAAGRRTRTSVALSRPTRPLAPRWATTSASVRSRIPSSTVQPRSAVSGRTSPTARVIVERDTRTNRHVVGDSVAQMHEGGQQPVEEHQPMPGTGPDCPLTRPIGPARLPARAQLSQDLPGRPGHPAISDSRGSGQAPRHTTTLPRASRASRPANHARGHEESRALRGSSRAACDRAWAANTRATMTAPSVPIAASPSTRTPAHSASTGLRSSGE